MDPQSGVEEVLLLRVTALVLDRAPATPAFGCVPRLPPPVLSCCHMSYRSFATSPSCPPDSLRRRTHFPPFHAYHVTLLLQLLFPEGQ